MEAIPKTTTATELKHVSRLYGNFAAIRDVSLSIRSGSSVVLLGDNGAGKSTLLRVIAGLTSTTYGNITVFGEKPQHVRERLAYMSHAPMLYDELTGLENLEYFVRLHSLPNTVRDAAPDSRRALKDVGLDPDLTRRVGEYSQGMRQRASLARVLLTAPDLLLLDEPFSNLDIASSQAMIHRLQSFLQQPSPSGVLRTLVLTTHQAELARPLAGTTLRMNAGRLISSELPVANLN